MPVAIKYEHNRVDQVFMIRKIANNSIKVIWLAGIIAILLLVGYFFYYSENGWINRNGFEKSNGSKKQEVDIMFSDKTTLVNIALRMQAVPAGTEPEPGGTIGISKIIHDQKLKKIIKKPVKEDFSIRAVPK